MFWASCSSAAVVLGRGVGQVVLLEPVVDRDLRPGRGDDVDVADLHALAGDVGEDVSDDLVALAAVVEREARRAEPRERVALEAQLVRVRHRDVGGQLDVLDPHTPLELVLLTRRQLRVDEVQAVLGEARVAFWRQVSGLGERQALEVDPPERLGRRALALDEILQNGRDDPRGREVLALPRLVVELLLGLVEVPLPRAVEQLERVLHRAREVDAFRAAELRREPEARLFHQDLGVRAVRGDALDLAARLGPLEVAVLAAAVVDELDAVRVAPGAYRGVRGRVAEPVLRAVGVRRDELGDRAGDAGGLAGADRAPAVDVELVGREVADRRAPDALRAVVDGPAGDVAAAADRGRGLLRCAVVGGPIDDLVAVGAAVARGGGERPGLGAAVRSAREVDDEVAGHRGGGGAHLGLRGLEGAGVGAGAVGAGAARGDVELLDRGGRRLDRNNQSSGEECGRGDRAESAHASF